MPRDFQIIGHLISPDLNSISGPRGVVRLEPKIMEVLVCLAAAEGEVVTREALHEKVWGETIVGDDVITRSIGQLRKVFDDDSKEPHVIQTIPRRGYRLVAAVTRPPAGSGQPGAIAPPVRARNWLRWLSIILMAVILGIVMVHTAMRDNTGTATRTVLPARVIPITSFPGSEVDPAVNPAGNRVAFAWRAPGEANLDIHIMDYENGRLLRLTFHEADERHPAWSPDGRRLAFIREGEDCSVYVMPGEGGAAERVADCGDRRQHNFVWTRDGKGLVQPWREAPGQPARLRVLSLDTGSTRDLTRPSADHDGDFEPAVSPAGEQVAFVRVRASGAQDVHIVSIDGGPVRRLTFDDQLLTGLDWTSDGLGLVFSSERAGIFSLWWVAADGGEPMWIAGGGLKLKDPSTARTRDIVVYENWDYEPNIGRMPLQEEAGSPERVIHSTQWDM
jgi:DNA-binding winged helix-turn-helix (wHTH) protein